MKNRVTPSGYIAFAGGLWYNFAIREVEYG